MKAANGCEECDVDFFVTARFGIRPITKLQGRQLAVQHIRLSKQTMAETNQFGVTPTTIQYWWTSTTFDQAPRPQVDEYATPR